ncbi:hypothetical protein PAHAL_2G015900 [Panicum hallii]|uniref:Uncharacterized protein n=1 Tax=Panicum hallii TaxID=206008 RepID=A0A2T8KMJ7_9POAL|nr:uncharacterized protein LOC112882866 isoform X1 [Panicum hallii]PVH63374.1 hypothetical protein PAHAL_2G015900 [Panicum hallii]
MAGMIPIEMQTQLRQLLAYFAANPIVHGGNQAAAGEKLLIIYLNGEGTSRASIVAPQGITFHEVRGRIYDRLGLANVDDQHRMEIRADFHNGGGANPPVPVADEEVWGFIFSNTTAPTINLHVSI